MAQVTPISVRLTPMTRLQLAVDQILGNQAGSMSDSVRVAKNPPHSVRMAKRLLRESQHQPLESLLELSAAMQALAHHTEDHDEALAAFSDKRAGNYQGR